MCVLAKTEAPTRRVYADILMPLCLGRGYAMDSYETTRLCLRKITFPRTVATCCVIRLLSPNYGKHDRSFVIYSNFRWPRASCTITSELAKRESRSVYHRWPGHSIESKQAQTAKTCKWSLQSQYGLVHEAHPSTQVNTNCVSL